MDQGSLVALSLSQWLRGQVSNGIKRHGGVLFLVWQWIAYYAVAGVCLVGFGRLGSYMLLTVYHFNCEVCWIRNFSRKQNASSFADLAGFVGLKA